jgi:hypothetical protein
VIDGGRHGIGTEFPDVVAAHVRNFMHLGTTPASIPTIESNGTAA